MIHLQEEVGDGTADFVSTTYSDDQSVSKLSSKQTSARREQKTAHVGHSLFLYYGVFTMVPRNNVPIQNEDMLELIVDIIMSRKMSITSTTISLNAEVASWNKSNKSISSLLVLESNVGEDGLSAQSTYGVNIEDKNEIKLLLPCTEMFGNEVYLRKKTPVRIYTQFTRALNDVHVQISSNSTLFTVWQSRFVNTLISQVMAEGVVINSNDIKFHDWSQK
jgi:hypothetical protein